MVGLSLLAAVFFNLFLIINPVAAVPVFLSITSEDVARERHAMVLRAVIVAFLLLAAFALVGRGFLDYFGISLPAIRITGGLLIFIISMEMLFGRVTRTATSEHEQQVASEKEDISITPLAIPLLAGPGSITAVMLFSHKDSAGPFIVIVALVFVMLICWALLRFSDALHRLLGPIGLKVISRIMGLLLAFLSVQLVIDGVTAAMHA